MEIKIKFTDSGKEIEEARFIREKVFQEEQGIERETDFDGMDQNAEHVIVYVDGQPVGTARVRDITDRKKLAKVERVAVLKEYRHLGLGRGIMDYIEDYLRQNGIYEIKLDSQDEAKGFYEKLGYLQKGEPFEEAGKPHVEMRKNL